MRTLVIGLPLPHPTFDNYSFLSAPSFFDYESMIVEVSAVSRVIQEVVDESGDHATFGGQPIVNGPTGPQAVGLADLLRQRREETHRFLARPGGRRPAGRGGLLVCFAHPDVPHPGVYGFPDCHRYYWLPAPEGLGYGEPYLLPGYGHRGVLLEDENHPFAPYVEAYGQRLTYRAYFAEDVPRFGELAHVFARSPGGAAVGVEVRVPGGSVVFLPPIDRLDMSRDRIPLAQLLFDCLQRALGQPARPGQAQPPGWLRRQASARGG